MKVAFVVHGIAAPQGSKIRTKYGGMRESSKRLHPWRADVARRAAEAMGATDDGNGQLAPMLEGALSVRLLFVMPRPKAHFGSGRNADKVKLSAPVYPEVSPDIDKAARAMLDACTGIVFRNDAQVADLHAAKRYGAPARCEVTVGEMVERAIEAA